MPLATGDRPSQARMIVNDLLRRAPGHAEVDGLRAPAA